MTNYLNIFETDHSQYESLSDAVVGSPKRIPLSLEQRAKNCLAEMSLIQWEFEKYNSEWESMLKEREKKFEDAFQHFVDTKERFVRVEDSEGNIHWLDMGEEEITSRLRGYEGWPFGDTSEWA